jgi:hypothetical protein
MVRTLSVRDYYNKKEEDTMSEIQVGQEITWTEPKPVETTAVVDKCRIKQVTVMLRPDGMAVNTPYEWLDAEGNVIRKGTDRQTPKDIKAKLGEQHDTFLQALTALADGGRLLVLNFGAEDVLSITVVGNGTPKKLDEAAIGAVIDPAMFKQTIFALGQSIVLGQ